MTYFLPPSDAVTSAARGLALAHPGRIQAHTDPLYLRTLVSAPNRTVALISGGGSGHEPLHTGLLGPGGLDAVCPGEVFASPHNRQIYAAGTAVAKRDGVLLIVKNYTGDVINFQIAAERLRHDGVPVATVLVDDDVATDNEDAATGRRGTAATVVVEKLLGAFADQGAKLEDLAAVGAEIVAHSRSVAVAARAQTSPATGRPAFALDSGALEYGVGIHGERGTGTIGRRPVGDLVRRMTEDLLQALPARHDSVLAVVNGLGATTSLELHAIASLLQQELTTRGIQLAALVPGTFTAALDMAGFSITLTAMKPEWIPWWTAPADTPLVLPSGLMGAETAMSAVIGAAGTPASADTPVQPERPDRAILDAFSRAVSEARDNLTTLDQLVGDGDFGDNLAGGVRRAVALNVAGTEGMTALAEAFLNEVGGTSGPLFGLLFQQLAVVAWPDDRAPDARSVADAAASGLAAISRVGGAEVGDCTMVDALTPAVQALSAAADIVAGSPLTVAAGAAIQGALGTASLAARRGRASYVGEHAIGVADPGALGVALLFSVLARVYEPTASSGLPSPQQVTAR